MLSFLLTFTAASDPALLVELAQAILSHVVAGQWWPAAAAGVAALGIVVRRWGAELWPVLGTVPGMIGSSFLLAFSGGILNVLAAGDAITAAVIWTALQIGGAAAGGWVAVEKLVAWWKARRA